MSKNLVKLIDKAKKQGTSAYKISQDTGISQTSLGCYYRGERELGVKNAQILSKYFGVSVDYLLDGKNKKHPNENVEVLTESEKAVLIKFRKLSPDGQAVYSAALEIALKNQGTN